MEQLGRDPEGSCVGVLDGAHGPGGRATDGQNAVEGVHGNACPVLAEPRKRLLEDENDAPVERARKVSRIDSRTHVFDDILGPAHFSSPRNGPLLDGDDFYA